VRRLPKKGYAMLKTDWTKVKYFNAEEKWGDADKMNPLLVYSLDALRKIAGRPIIINSGYRPNDPGSTHRNGDAADIVITGLSVIDQFLLAEKTRLFSGIGVYPFWNRPGLHLDVRPLRANQHGPRWGRNAAGVYVALDSKFLIECF
jgi:uncharacterized protein YcbK (DUF882 family)